jgi:hypothetical protein
MPTNHSIDIQSIPVAISSTIAIVVGTVVIILINRKRKEMFLEDYIIHSSDNESPTTTAEHMDTTSPAPIVAEVYSIQYPPSTRPISKSVHPTLKLVHPSLEPDRKLEAVLGWEDNNDFRHDRQIQSPSIGHHSYYIPRPAHRDKYNSDEETLNVYETNSAYLPYPHSDVSDSTRKQPSHWLEVPRRLASSDRSQVSDADSAMRRSPISLASRTRLGDAY